MFLITVGALVFTPVQPHVLRIETDMRKNDVSYCIPMMLFSDLLSAVFSVVVVHCKFIECTVIDLEEDIYPAITLVYTELHCGTTLMVTLRHHLSWREIWVGKHTSM